MCSRLLRFGWWALKNSHGVRLADEGVPRSSEVADCSIIAAQEADGLLEQAVLNRIHKWLAIAKRINILLERPNGPLH